MTYGGVTYGGVDSVSCIFWRVPRVSEAQFYDKNKFLFLYSLLKLQ